MSLYKSNTAVIVVDIQGSFTTWKNGEIAANGADQNYVDEVEAATRKLRDVGYLMVGTQEWHPANHISFVTQHPNKKPFDQITVDGRPQTLWPEHCIQNQENAELLINSDLLDHITQKGTRQRYDSYSGFKDDGNQATDLHHFLQQHEIQRVIIYGLATDYCVKATAIDVVHAGYKTIVITELSRGISPETTALALQEMQAQGVTVVKRLNLEQL